MGKKLFSCHLKNRAGSPCVHAQWQAQVSQVQPAGPLASPTHIPTRPSVGTRSIHLELFCLPTPEPRHLAQVLPDFDMSTQQPSYPAVLTPVWPTPRSPNLPTGLLQLRKQGHPCSCSGPHLESRQPCLHCPLGFTWLPAITTGSPLHSTNCPFSHTCPPWPVHDTAHRWTGSQTITNAVPTASSSPSPGKLLFNLSWKHKIVIKSD